MGELEEFSHKGVLLRVLALANEGVRLVVLQKKTKKKINQKIVWLCWGGVGVKSTLEPQGIPVRSPCP